jgi:hypothetical protein
MNLSRTTIPTAAPARKRDWASQLNKLAELVAAASSRTRNERH